MVIIIIIVRVKMKKVSIIIILNNQKVAKTSQLFWIGDTYIVVICNLNWFKSFPSPSIFVAKIF